MKLLEMSTDKACDAMITIAPEIEPIILDAELLSELGKGTSDKEKAPEVGIRKFARVTPVLLGKYRQNVFRILGALNDKTPEGIAEQSVSETMEQIRELLSDEELLRFFHPSASTARRK